MTDSPQSTSAAFRSLGLTSAECDAVLDRFADGPAAAALNVGGEVITYRARAELSIEHPGGGIGNFEVYFGYLGPQQAVLIHSGYIHVGSKCRFAMRTTWGATERLAGTVSGCEFVSRSIHRLTVRFDPAIDLRQFVERGPELHRFLSRNVRPSQLSGDLLLVDDQVVEAQLLRHHLKATAVQVTAALNSGAALDLVRTTDYHVILCDLGLEGAEGEGVIRAIREVGYKGPMVAVTGESSPARLAAAKSAGASATLAKPYERERLLMVLAEWLPTLDAANSAQQAIHSTREGEPGMNELIESYLRQLERMVHDLDVASSADDLARCRFICQTINETGAGFGFQALTDLARTAVTAMDASSSVQESMREIARIKGVWGRLRAPALPE